MRSFEELVQSKFDSEFIKTMLNIKYTANFLNTLGNKELEPFGISTQQYNILRILRGAQKPITMNEVKERMIEKSPNVTRLIDKLLDKNYLQRYRCEEDRRAVYVTITQEGLQVLNEVAFAEVNQTMQKLSVTEVKLLGELLDKLKF